MGFDFHDSLMFVIISISTISIGLFVSSKISLGKIIALAMTSEVKE